MGADRDLLAECRERLERVEDTPSGGLIARCPFSDCGCGRFRVVTAGVDDPWYHCHQCGRSGDVVDLLDDLAGHGAPQQARPRIQLLSDILADPDILDPPEPLADRIAYRGYVTLLAAREKLGKSTLAGSVAASVSAGLPWLGSPVAPAPVLVASLDEHVRDTVRRLVACRAAPESVGVLTSLGTQADPLGALGAAVEEMGPALVVIDTLAEFVRDLGIDSGDASAWTPVIGGLARLARESDTAVLLLHHTRKDGTEYRDSTAIGASVDLILTMQRVDGDIQARRITARGRLPVDDFTVRLDGDPHDLEHNTPHWRLTTGELSLDARILRYVESRPGASTRDVRGNVEGRNGDIDATIRRLLAAEAIEDRGGSRGRSLYVGRGTVGTVGDDPHGHATGTVGAQSGHGGRGVPGGSPHRGESHPGAHSASSVGTPSSDAVAHVSEALAGGN